MRLCSNRPEGFGPSSVFSSPLPTSCFVDTVLLPLPVWLAIALLPILYLYTRSYRQRHFDPSTLHLQAPATSKPWFAIISTLYYILIVCNILMQTLEIVRLELLHFGIGLQPFVYVGLLLGALLHYTQGFGSRIRFWACINAIIWVGGIIVCIVQVIGLTNEGIDGRKGSKYPVSDQVIDAAVIAGVYAAIALLEIVLGAWRRTKARGMKSEFQGEDTAEFVNVNLGKGTSHPTDK